MKLGVMGGTFDPIHIGHMVVVEEARYQYGLDHVVLVPSARPPHKTGISNSPPEDRMRMVSFAIDGNVNLSVSDIEIEREGLSYTVDTLHELRRIHGESTDLYFIIGADALLEIMSWKNPGEVMAQSRFVVAPRPGYLLESVKRVLQEPEDRWRPSAENILEIEMPALDISSTDIRKRVAKERPFRYLVPEKVWSYIVQAGLYRRR